MPRDFLKTGQKASGIAALISFLLAIAKAVIGLLSGSIALLSDAVHSIADMTVMIASWFGLKISQKKPDEKFPYGYYKAESLATLFVSVIILYAAFQLLLEGYSRIFVLTEISFPILAMSVALISSTVSFAVSRYLLKTGKHINSQLLLTSSKERLMDTISSAIVFVAILMSYWKVPYVEGIVTIVIAILIFKVGIFSIRDSVFALMDTSPSKKTESKIRRIIKNTKGVDDFAGLKLRKSGPFIFGEAKIKVNKSINVKRAHEIADEIEGKIKTQVKEADSFIIHIEPYKGEKHRIVIPVFDNKGLDSRVMEHFGRANFFIFIDIEKNKIIKTYSKSNTFKKKSVRAGLSAAHYLVKENADILVTKEIGEISFHTLRDHLIDIYKTKGKTVEEVADNFIKKKLIRLKEATRDKD